MAQGTGRSCGSKRTSQKHASGANIGEARTDDGHALLVGDLLDAAPAGTRANADDCLVPGQHDLVQRLQVEEDPAFVDTGPARVGRVPPRPDSEGDVEFPDDVDGGSDVDCRLRKDDAVWFCDTALGPNICYLGIDDLDI